MSNSIIKSIDKERVPVIDIKKINSASNKIEIAKELYKASTDLGFIYIKNHDISENLINDLRTDGLNFFRSSTDDKSKVLITKKHRGWLGFGGAKMGDKAKPDLKESFIWGYQYDDGSLPDDHQLRGVNKWPEFLPSLQQNAMSYFHQINELAKNLLTCFALGLNLEENFFIRNCNAPLSRASLVYYPDQPKEIRRLTQNQGSNESASFSPDGRHIVFTSSRTGRSNLYIMTNDGFAQYPLTQGGGYASPSWGR